MTTASIGALLHEGKAKRVHATDRADVVAVEYKDDATAFTALKKGSPKESSL
jgi:phosphoribosylaminoimidazole-succinocarboxamide synthase